VSSLKSGKNKTTNFIIPPAPTNYRSNIASRCRTAVNTGQLPQTVIKNRKV
jgi:hypothetical protein